MDVEEILILVGAVVLVFIPALALTARFALRPIVEAIIRLREGLLGNPIDRCSSAGSNEWMTS